MSWLGGLTILRQSINMCCKRSDKIMVDGIKKLNFGECYITRTFGFEQKKRIQFREMYAIFI